MSIMTTKRYYKSIQEKNKMKYRKKKKLKKSSKRYLNILLRTTQELTHKLILPLPIIAGKLHNQLDCIHQVNHCI